MKKKLRRSASWWLTMRRIIGFFCRNCWQGQATPYCRPAASAALLLLRSENILLVITDLCMAAADGIDFCKVIAAEFATIPCIVFTAYASSRTEAALKAVGISGWLDKPFANQQVLELVAEVLAGNQPLPGESLAKESIPVTGEQEVL